VGSERVTNGVFVLVWAQDARCRDYWQYLNGSWYPGSRDALAFIQTGDPRDVLHLAGAPGDQIVEFGTPELDASRSFDLLKEQLEGRDILIANWSGAAESTWRNAVAAAQPLLPIAAATGRWLVPGGEGPALSLPDRKLSYFDRTPAWIASSADFETYVPGVHCTVAKHLPPEFVWIDARRGDALLDCFRSADHLIDAIELFFAGLAEQPDSYSVYLPDLKVYETGYVFAV
jgi:hypothetical protein